MLHYGDVEEDAENPAIETLQDKSESSCCCERRQVRMITSCWFLAELHVKYRPSQKFTYTGLKLKHNQTSHQMIRIC